MLSFFFNDTPTTEIYTLSLHDALPILAPLAGRRLGLDYRLQHRRRVVVELIGLKRHFTNRHLHNAGLLHLVLNAALTDLRHGFADLKRHRAGFRIWHESAGTELFSELTNRRHQIRRRDRAIEIHPTALDLFHEIIGPHKIGAGLTRLLLLLALGKYEHA